MLDTITSFTWTEDNVTLLRQRYEAGVSAGKIADEFGAGCTRNAVIGKIHRLGLVRDVTNVAGRPRNDGAAKKPVARDAAPKRPEIKPAPAKVVVAPKPRPTPAPRPICEPVPADGVLIHELETRHCRWPVIDVPAGRGDEMRYCGSPRVPQGPNDPWRPYCSAHARMAYAPRRSDRERAADERRSEALLRRRNAAA